MKLVKLCVDATTTRDGVVAAYHEDDTVDVSPQVYHDLVEVLRVAVPVDEDMGEDGDEGMGDGLGVDVNGNITR